MAKTKVETKEEIKTKPREVIGNLVRISDKTLKINVESKFRHPMYDKIIKTHKKYLADFDGKEELTVGDEILIQECKPISAKKTWKFIKVIKKAE